MLFDTEALSARQRYKILTATIVPRPIAWITTLSRAGVTNAAPFPYRTANRKGRRFPARSGDEALKQVRFRLHDPNLIVRDLNALGESAQVIPPIAAPFDPKAAARGLRKRVDHLRCNGSVAGAVERHIAGR